MTPAKMTFYTIARSLAQAFQPVLAQAKACGYQPSLLERHSVLNMRPYQG
jgi:hypothetical protein